ncbi:MAG TPA: hypothetical protein VMO52_09645 [Acidimicrobiia bacterium]|nr:hypothetical protein [Acidimicrobiia bacterium]
MQHLDGHNIHDFDRAANRAAIRALHNQYDAPADTDGGSGLWGAASHFLNPL